MADPRNDDSRQKYLRQEYISRINRVIDFIEANLDQELSLASLATVANFSQFHFHRIFRAMVGETLNGFIQRIRLEKAAARLLDHPKNTITEIAFDCGFSGSATFARAFRERYQMSASQWRSDGHIHKSKNRKTNSNNGQAIGLFCYSFCDSCFFLRAHQSATRLHSFDTSP